MCEEGKLELQSPEQERNQTSFGPIIQPIKEKKKQLATSLVKTPQTRSKGPDELRIDDIDIKLDKKKATTTTTSIKEKKNNLR